jgi:hypothetical protein
MIARGAVPIAHTNSRTTFLPPRSGLAVQSQGEVERIKCKAVGFYLPARTDELERREAGQGFESFCEVVGVEEGGEVFLELSMGLVMIGANCCFLDRAIHAFDLAVGPRVVGLGEAVIDIVASTREFESVSPEDLASGQGQLDVLRCRSGIARGGEVGAVVGKNDVDAVGDGLDQFIQELRSDAAGGLLDQPGESELGSAVDRDEEVEFSLLGADLCQIDMEVTDGIGFELLAGRAGCIEMGQSADAVALEATVKGGAGELRDGGLESVEAVIKRQERVLAKGHDDGLLLTSQGRGMAFFGSHGSVLHEGTLAPLMNGLGVDVVARGER